MIPSYFHLWISSPIIETSCGEKRRCLSATGVHDSSIRGNESSPSTHGGTRLESVRNSSPLIKWWSKSAKRAFCVRPS